jgi:hypothetical protein
MSESPFSGAVFNIVKHRGDPKSAFLQSGHTVLKEDYVFFKDDRGMVQKMKCSDYHGTHFVYLDPVYNDDEKGKGHWAFMCTCGSPAVIVGPGEAELEDVDSGERLLVCMAYHQTLKAYGVGQHGGSDGRRWT